MKPHPSRTSIAFLLSCYLVIASTLLFPAGAQISCGGGTLNSNGPLTAWPQNTLISVNINSNSFTKAEYDNCIKPVFDAYNLQNAASEGNWSGVRFSLTYGTNTVAVVNNQQADNVGVTHGYEVNRDANIPGPGRTYRSDDGTHRDSAVTSINTAVTNCSALAQTIAHEIGHTLGLGECTGCAAGASVMNGALSMNDTTMGATSPTNCDNSVIRTSGTYSQETVDQPDDRPTSTEGGQIDCNDWIDNDGDGLIDCEDGGCGHYCTDGCNQAQWDICAAVGAPHCVSGQCYTPILIDTHGDGFKLTDAKHGVWYKVINGKSVPIAWTVADSDDAWLVLDRNDNGSIDGGEEQFGNATPQPAPPPGVEKNGFLALAEFDKEANGGNGDGVINPSDAIFTSLRLWQDINHNGLSEATELHTLSELGLATLELTYKESKRIDQYGNLFRYRAKVKDQHDNQIGRWAWDVFLRMAP